MVRTDPTLQHAGIGLERELRSRNGHKSGDIAEIMGRKVTSVAPLRSALISKGMVYSPEHGDTAFTVPLFDEFMKRIMPDSG